MPNTKTDWTEYTYRNPWAARGASDYYVARRAPKFPEYRGFLVFDQGDRFDYVWNGWAICQRAGAMRPGYRAVIDSFLDGSTWQSDKVAKHLSSHPEYRPYRESAE